MTFPGKWLRRIGLAATLFATGCYMQNGLAALDHSTRQNAQPTGQPVELAAILMDVRGERALAHAHHYAGVTSIYAFDGFEPAIRQAVDPKWRNITPYVVLIDRKGAVQRVIGPPNAAQLKAWRL